MNRMKLRNFLRSLILGGLLVPQLASATVFVRISGSELPAVHDMGVKNLVFVWPISDVSAVRKVQAQGYQVFFEASIGDLSAAAENAEKMNIAGIILATEKVDGPGDNELFRLVTAAHPRLSFLLLIPAGKRPKLGGGLSLKGKEFWRIS